MAEITPYDRIRPNKNKAASYDLVGTYDWTSVPRTAALRDEAPAAWITAYELKYSALRSFIDGYMNVLAPQNSDSNYANSKTPGLDFYKGLYAVGETPIARFSFPYFTDNIRAFSTEFSDTFSPVSQRGAKMLGGDFIQGLGGAGESLIGGTAAAITQFGHMGNPGGTSTQDFIAKNTQAAVGKLGESFFKAMGVENPGLQTIGAPGTYIETPKFYQYSNTDNTLDVGFALSNTLNADAIEKNYKFIKDFTRINRPFRTGPIGMTYPAIYQIVVPGVRYIQWAFLSDFNIGMIGSRRKISKPGGGPGCKVVPEAYSCQFSFRSLTVEAANFIDELEKYCGYASYGTQMIEQEKELMHNQEIRDRATPPSLRRTTQEQIAAAGGPRRTDLHLPGSQGGPRPNQLEPDPETETFEPDTPQEAERRRIGEDMENYDPRDLFQPTSLPIRLIWEWNRHLTIELGRANSRAHPLGAQDPEGPTQCPCKTVKAVSLEL